MSIDNSHHSIIELQKPTIAATQRNTPLPTSRLVEGNNYDLSRATELKKNLGSRESDDFSDFYKTSTNRDNKTPQTEDYIATFTGVPETRHLKTFASKKTILPNQKKRKDSQHIRKSPRSLLDIRYSDFHQTTIKDERRKVSKSPQFSKHIKSLSSVCYNSVTKKKPLMSERHGSSVKKSKLQWSKSSKSLNANIYSPAYHMKLNMIRVQQK